MGNSPEHCVLESLFGKNRSLSTENKLDKHLFILIFSYSYPGKLPSRPQGGHRFTGFPYSYYALQNTPDRNTCSTLKVIGSFLASRANWLYAHMLFLSFASDLSLEGKASSQL